MHDLYTNYDCDVQCTNLFDAIITALCMRAVPIGLQTHFETPSEMTGTSNGKEKEHGKDKDLNTETIKVDIMNRLALHGVLTILNAISGRDISYIQTSYGTSNSQQQQQLQPPSHFQTTVPSSSSPSPSSSGIIRPVATRPNQTNQTNQTSQVMDELSQPKQSIGSIHYDNLSLSSYNKGKDSDIYNTSDNKDKGSRDFSMSSNSPTEEIDNQ